MVTPDTNVPKTRTGLRMHNADTPTPPPRLKAGADAPMWPAKDPAILSLAYLGELGMQAFGASSYRH